MDGRWKRKELMQWFRREMTINLSTILDSVVSCVLLYPQDHIRIGANKVELPSSSVPTKASCM